MFSPSDLVFVYSGGSTNADPALSLGGQPSDRSIPGTIDNLFDDVQGTNSVRVDYRCFYVFNDNLTMSLEGTQVSIANQAETPGDVVLGFRVASDVQQIRTTTTNISGTVAFTFDGHTFNTGWDPNPISWAATIQHNLEAIVGTGQVACVGGYVGANSQVTVTFVAGRYYPLIVAHTDVSLDPCPNCPGTQPFPHDILTAKIQDGGPINNVTVQIASSTTPPNGITFSDQPTTIGDLNPSDGFPVWVRRTTPTGDPDLSPDGFTIALTGTPALFQASTTLPQNLTFLGGGTVTLSGSGSVMSTATIFKRSYAGSGTVRLGGNATTTSPTGRISYTGQGVVTISGHATFFMTSLAGTQCQFCCADGQYPVVYELTVSGFGSPTCNACSKVNGVFSLVLDPNTCTWTGTNGQVTYQLWHDETTGLWNLFGDAGACG